MLPNALTALLTAILAGALIWLTALGIAQMRRAAAISRRSLQDGLRFSPGDPFDLPSRYSSFAVISAGHSPQARNITYGRVGGRGLRTFDFGSEAGHGTRRICRRYTVAAIESGADLPPLAMWHRDDADSAPLAARFACDPVGPWMCAGDVALAGRISAACQQLAEAGASIQTSGGVMLVCVPLRLSAGLAWNEQLLKPLLDVLEG